MKNKYFIITIDTEGDNLWDYKEGDEIQTKNALYIPRFQELCEKYGFKPVYLTNYEMILSSDFVQYIRPKVEAGLCEVGIHIHAWNNPPYYELNGPYDGNPYLIEYPYDVMREKFKVTYDLICERIGVPPVSHRAGRWAMNDEYFQLLKEFDIKVDCSYTPGINWRNCGRTIQNGSDYQNIINKIHKNGDIIEVPVSIRTLYYSSHRSLKHKLKTFLGRGQQVWLRPTTNTFEEMKYLVKKIEREDSNYIEFMIHSSEFMAGGSPYFKDAKSIDKLFNTIEDLFQYIFARNYEGIMLNGIKNYV